MPLTFDDYLAGKRKPVTFDAFIAKKADTGVAEPQAPEPEEDLFSEKTAQLQLPRFKPEHIIDVPGVPLPSGKAGAFIANLPIAAAELMANLTGMLMEGAREARFGGDEPTSLDIISPEGGVQVPEIVKGLVRPAAKLAAGIKTRGETEAGKELFEESLGETVTHPESVLLPFLIAAGARGGRGRVARVQKAPRAPVETGILSDIIPKERIPTERVPIVEEVLGVEKAKPKLEVAKREVKPAPASRGKAESFMASKEIATAVEEAARAGHIEPLEVVNWMKAHREYGGKVRTKRWKDAVIAAVKARPERGAVINPFQEITTATSEMIQKAKAPPEITAGVKKAKEAMIEHDRQIRRSEFTSKQFEKVVKDNIPTTEREMLMVHAYEHKTTGPYWDKLSPLEKKITEWAAGEKAKLNQFIKDNQVLEMMPEQEGINHIFHHWIDPKTKQPYAAMYSKFSKGLPQAKQRVIPDYATGMQATPENPMGTGVGMKPATTNLGKLIGLEWESVMRAHQSRQMFKTLHHIGADPQTTIQLRTGKAPKPIRMIENWNKLQDQGLTEGYERYAHWSLDKPITFKSGERLVTIKGPVGIRKELYPFVKAYIESPNYGAYDRLNFMSKQFKLGGTLFHAVQLGIQEIANRRIPFKNIPRGLKARKNLEPDLKLLHQEGLELFKGYEDVGYRNKFFKGTTIFGKSGNVATYPIRMLRDFLFEVIQPGMKTSFALDKLRKLRPKMLKEGFTENQTARAAVKMADGHFSGEHYKRSMLETNRFVTNLFFSPKGRRLMQRLWLSFTWQREHALVAKDVAKSFMPQKMIRKLHLSEMSKAEKAEYRKYAVAAAVIISSADTYNYMATEAMDGEGKHLWQNPKDKGFAVRAWWNEPSYTVIDKNGKKRTIRGGPAYFRPLKSVFEVAEWVSDPLMKFKNKLAPLISATGQQLWPSKYQKEYKGWGDMPIRAKDFMTDAFQPIGVGKPIQVIQGKRDPKAAILPFLGFPTSKVTEKKKKKTRSILSKIGI